MNRDKIIKNVIVEYDFTQIATSLVSHIILPNNTGKRYNY